MFFSIYYFKAFSFVPIYGTGFLVSGFREKMVSVFRFQVPADTRITKN